MRREPSRRKFYFKEVRFYFKLVILHKWQRRRSEEVFSLLSALLLNPRFRKLMPIAGREKVPGRTATARTDSPAVSAKTGRWLGIRKINYVRLSDLSLETAIEKEVMIYEKTNLFISIDDFHVQKENLNCLGKK